MDSLPKSMSIESEVLRNGIYYKEKIHIDVAIRLADEYMAEAAGNYISDRNFIENMVGLGVLEVLWELEENYLRKIISIKSIIY